MGQFNDDLILEYLIENIDPNLNKKHSLKTILMLDYCYKKDEKIPQNIIPEIISKVINKQINNSSKPLNLDESNLNDCLFLDAFDSYLSSKTKSLAKDAKTPKDFKAITIIDEFSKRIDGSEKILNSPNSLDSKVFNFAKMYQNSNLNKELNKEYLKMKEYFLRVNDNLRKPLTQDIIGEFSKIKKELEEKQRVYSKYPDTEVVFEIQSLIRDTNSAIDNKLNDFISNINPKYNKVKKIFEDGIWDSERKINRLINLRSELKDAKDKYRLGAYKEGIGLCNSLDRKIKETISNYNYIKDKKEEFQDVKRLISDYYGEMHSIFGSDIDFSSVRRINSIYSNLKRLSDKNFHECVPSAWQEDYYLKIDAAMDYIEQKCNKRATYLVNKSSKYRQKIDSSFFSWKTKKFTERLKEYDYELEAWSKCRMI